MNVDIFEDIPQSVIYQIPKKVSITEYKLELPNIFFNTPPASSKISWEAAISQSFFYVKLIAISIFPLATKAIL